MKQAACIIVPRWADKPAGYDVLTVSRRKAPNMWGLPGGKVDPGESVAGAAIRELREETGIFLFEKELVPIYATLCPGEVPYWVTTYLSIADIGNVEGIIVPEEGLKVTWHPLTILTDPDICPFARYNCGVIEAFQRYRGEDTWAQG